MLKCLLVASGRSGPGDPARAKEQLIAHRGASAYAPEHTIAAYTRALEQGRHFVEQDLRRHEGRRARCTSTTSPSNERPTSRTCSHIDSARTCRQRRATPDRSGESGHRWLVNDFTLEEIKRLDAGPGSGPPLPVRRFPHSRRRLTSSMARPGCTPS